MGSGTQYYDDDEPAFHRRYNGRSYAVNHDRELSHHVPYIGHGGHTHDARNIPDTEPSSSSNVRRRIPVACGRCRKRKIRCSGDPGNGGSCTNCKSAGNELCQFLRVSSREAPLKGEQADNVYDNSAIVTRVHRGASIPHGLGQQYYNAPTPLGLDGYPYHRQNSVPFQYPIKAYYNLHHSYGDVADDNIDYSNAPYQLMSTDQLAIAAYAGHQGSSNSGRSWTHTAPPHLPKSTNSIYMESDALLSHPQFHQNTFPIRPAGSPESKSLSLNSMATALPVAAGPDRVLPYPAAGRQHQAPPLLRSSESHGSLNRSMDGLPYSGISTTMMNGGLGGVKSLNDAAVENSSLSTSYHSMPSSESSSQQASESYATQDNRLYPASNSSTEDLRYISSGSRRQSGPYSEITGTMAPSTSILSSGHEYMPLPNRGYYPTPPMVPPQVEMQSGAHQSRSRNHSVPSIPAV